MKILLRRTYFWVLYNHSPRLFVPVAGFFLLTIAADISKIEATPFFVWAMYSEPAKPKQEYQILRVTINNKVFDYSAGEPEATRFFLTTPITTYAKMKSDIKAGTGKAGSFQERYPFITPLLDKTENNPTRYLAMEDWYKRYIHAVSEISTQKLKLEWAFCKFDSSGALHESSRQLIPTSTH